MSFEHEQSERGVGSHDPIPMSAGSTGSSPGTLNLWEVLSEQGARILECLGTDSLETLCLRESSGRLRCRVASVHAVLRPPPIQSPRSEAKESTDSGLEQSSGKAESEFMLDSSEPEDALPWQQLQRLFGSSPMYRADASEDAWQAWLLCGRLWDEDLRT